MRTPEVDALLQSLASTVQYYPDTMVECASRIAGTAFFPCGDGLYKGTLAISPAWPERKVMVLGNDWGTKAALDAIELHEMNGSTWTGLIALLQDPLAIRGLVLRTAFLQIVLWVYGEMAPQPANAQADPTQRSRSSASIFWRSKSLP